MTHDNHARNGPFWVVQWGVILVGVVAFLGGCGESQSGDTADEPPALTVTPDTMTIDRVLRTDDRFSTLAAVLDSTGLDSTLAGEGPYTLLAPPNAAFARLPEGTLEVLLTERLARLRTILAHHVVGGRVGTDALAARPAYQTLSGDSLRVRRDSTLRVGPATVVEGDVETANGVIHVLDRVLPPPNE
jgi:uncharacterized surface protein with fasciclin (FAS1) repeats